MRGLNPVLIFLEASTSALVRRFSETRRPHPLAPDRSVSEGIRDERTRISPIRELADEIIDTSDMTVHELRHFFMTLSRGRSRATAGHHAPQLRVQARRAGRCRPHVRRSLPAEPALRARAAPADRSRPRRGGVHGARRGDARVHGRLEDYLRYVIPHYVAEGKSYLTIAIGCTGGRHRSVMIAERLRRALANVGRHACGSATGTSAMLGRGGHDRSRRRHARAARHRAGERGRDDRRRPAAGSRRSRSAGTTM